MGLDDIMTKAVAELPFKPIFEFQGEEIQVVCLLPNNPPLDAYWQKGKQVHLIAVDVDGNFFLRHSGGGVSYWNHHSKTEIEVSGSVKDFVSQLRADVNGKLEWRKKRD